MHLDIAANGLTDLSGLQHLGVLQSLDASHNVIADVTALASCSALQILKLSHNRLLLLHGLEQLHDLDTLAVDHNRITAVLQFRPLAVLPLRHLAVAGNPLFTDKEGKGNNILLSNVLPGTQDAMNIRLCDAMSWIVQMDSNGPRTIADELPCRACQPGWQALGAQSGCKRGAQQAWDSPTGRR